MRLKYVPLLFPIMVSLFLISCSEDPSTVGTGLLSQDEITVTTFNSLNDSTTQNSYPYKRISPIGDADRVLLGNANDVRSDVLLQFLMNIQDIWKDDIIEDSLTVESAYIVLTPIYQWGTDTSAEYAIDGIEAYRITETWNPLTVKLDSLPAFDSAKDWFLSRTVTDSSHEYDIDPQIVREWLRAEIDTLDAENYGIYMKPTGSTNYIVGYQGFSSSLETVPLLKVHLTKGTELDSVFTFKSLSDAHVITADIPPVDSGEVVVQGGVITYTRLQYDLSSIPENAVIISAELQLTADTAGSVIGTDALDYLSAYFISDISQDTIATIEASRVSLLKEGNVYSGICTEIVRRWFADSENYGFSISTGRRGEGLEIIRLYGSNNADLQLRPRLYINYTIRADH